MEGKHRKTCVFYVLMCYNKSNMLTYYNNVRKYLEMR